MKSMQTSGNEIRTEKTLKEFSAGESGVVTRMEAQGALRRRLFDMGITPGTRILMRKTAPLGDPIEITLRGYELSIRKAEARTIFMQPEGSVN